MPDEVPSPPAMPEKIANRFRDIAAEVEKVVNEANQKMVTAIPERIAFRYESAVLNRNILGDYERRRRRTDNAGPCLPVARRRRDQ